MKAFRYTLILAMLLVLASCSKKGTLYENYWEAREAGAYKVTSVHVKSYTSGNLTSDSSQTVGNTYFVMYTYSVDGFYNICERYGDWTPLFFKDQPYGKAWNMENDDQRLTFSADDGSGSYFPLATVTIDKVGDRKQQWDYVISNGNDYTHYTISVERTNKP